MIIRCLNNGKVFNSAIEASEWANITSDYLYKHLRGRTDYAGKDPVTGEPLQWEYVDKGIEDDNQLNIFEQAINQDDEIERLKTIINEKDEYIAKLEKKIIELTLI